MTINLNGEKITASKDMLNYLSIIFAKAGEKFEDEEANALAKTANKWSYKIYKDLSDNGFYAK